MRERERERKTYIGESFTKIELQAPKLFKNAFMEAGMHAKGYLPVGRS